MKQLRDSYRWKLKTRLEKKSSYYAKKDDNWLYFETMDFLRNDSTVKFWDIISINLASTDNPGDDMSTVDSSADITDNIGNIYSVVRPSFLSANFVSNPLPSDKVISISHSFSIYTWIKDWLMTTAITSSQVPIKAGENEHSNRPTLDDTLFQWGIILTTYFIQQRVIRYTFLVCLALVVWTVHWV